MRQVCSLEKMKGTVCATSNELKLFGLQTQSNKQSIAIQLVDLFLAKHNVAYSMSIPRRDKGCTPILVRLLRQINRIKPCG